MNATVFFDYLQIKEMAQFLAELTRQGCAWVANEHNGGWFIQITGY